jgi:hypothetical protein
MLRPSCHLKGARTHFVTKMEQHGESSRWLVQTCFGLAGALRYAELPAYPETPRCGLRNWANISQRMLISRSPAETVSPSHSP